MGADGRHQHDGVLRVAEGAARREVVGRRAGRGAHAKAVRQDRGEVFVIAEDFGKGHCLLGSLCKSRLCMYIYIYQR